MIKGKRIKKKAINYSFFLNLLKGYYLFLFISFFSYLSNLLRNLLYIFK